MMVWNVLLLCITDLLGRVSWDQEETLNSSALGGGITDFLAHPSLSAQSDLLLRLLRAWE